MTAHTLHPDTHDYGLADGCPRCTEHAVQPFAGLDHRNLGQLAYRVRHGLKPRSRNEQMAMYEIRTAMARGQMLAELLEEAEASQAVIGLA